MHEYKRAPVLPNNHFNKFGSASREDIHKLLVDKLPGTLTQKQKFYKVGNLLAYLRKNGRIVTDDHRHWHLAK